MKTATVCCICDPRQNGPVPKISGGARRPPPSFSKKRYIANGSLKNYLDKGQGNNDNGKQRITLQNNKKKQNLLRIAGSTLHRSSNRVKKKA
jgi:hypothetical protein